VCRLKYSRYRCNFFKAFAYSNATLFSALYLSFTTTARMYLRFHDREIILRLAFNISVCFFCSCTVLQA
jgi:hypothetical protein